MVRTGLANRTNNEYHCEGAAPDRGRNARAHTEPVPPLCSRPARAPAVPVQPAGPRCPASERLFHSGALAPATRRLTPSPPPRPHWKNHGTHREGPQVVTLHDVHASLREQPRKSGTHGDCPSGRPDAHSA
eukprot:7792578-Pyramimonas_sp.AAC.2